jgi:hypothetical protein
MKEISPGVIINCMPRNLGSVTLWHDLNAVKEKTLPLSRQGFFFVDKRFEISNLDLIRDMVEIIEIDNSIHFF